MIVHFSWCQDINQGILPCHSFILLLRDFMISSGNIFSLQKKSVYFIFNKMNSKRLQILYVRRFRFQYRPDVDKKYFYSYLHIGMFDYLAELLEYHLHTPSIINVLK